MKALKIWNSRYPASTQHGDSNFILKLLDIVFDHETLVRSSVNGTRSNNSGQIHEPLEANRLKFMKGTSIECFIL